MKFRILLLIFIISIVNINAKDILILHSYHATFSWTKEQTEAILKLLPDRERYRVYIEYMDTKRNLLTPIYEEELFNLYKSKYSNKNIDLIIATDDNAINFIKKYQKKLFKKDIFIVFSGVSNLKVLDNYESNNITGVYEKMTPYINYQLAKKIYPKVEKIYLIGDDSNTLNIKKAMFDNEFKNNNINYEYISNKNIEIVEEKLKNIEKNSLAFIVTPSSYTDSNNTVYTMEMALERLSKVYNKPFISISNIYMTGHNIIGGHTVNGTNQGRLAATLALDILEKNKINPPILNTNTYIFDYNVLKKFDIDVENLNLNENYKLINRPTSYYDIYKTEIQTASAILSVFFMIFIITVFYSIKLKKLNEELDYNNRYTKKLLDSLLEGVITIEDGICIDCNNEIVKILKYDSKNDLIGKNIFNLVAHKSKKRVQERIKMQITHPEELTLLTKDNKEITVLSMGRNINMNNRSLRVTSFIDISEAKQKDKLLFEQSKLAAMGEMIGNISHQWRQPLSVISTAASGIKFQKELKILDDKTLFDSTDVIVKSCTYLSQTIEDFKNYIRGKKSIELVNINEPLDICLTLLKSTFLNNNITLVENREDCNIYSSKNEIIQILINILNNAKDALINSKNEEKLLFIKTYEKDDFIVISIKDNAGGIPEDIIDKIFNPYFTTKDESQGTGLGLYMSYQVAVNSLKGAIKVTNDGFTYNNSFYKGSNFKIYLPK